MKKLLILSATLMLCACTVNANETTQIGLTECIQRIKEKIMFSENKVTAFGYVYQEISFESKEAPYKLLSDYDKTYLVETVYDNVYGSWDDRWFCGISFEKTEITAIECRCFSHNRL